MREGFIFKQNKEKKGIDRASLTEKERLLLWGNYINNVEEGIALMETSAEENTPGCWLSYYASVIPPSRNSSVKMSLV